MRLAEILHENPAEIALRVNGQAADRRSVPKPDSVYARNALKALHEGDHETAYELARRYSRQASMSGIPGAMAAAAGFLHEVALALPFHETMTLAFDHLSHQVLRRMFVHAAAEDLPVLTTLINDYLLSASAADPVDHARYLRNAARDRYKNGELESAHETFATAIQASEPLLAPTDLTLLELEQAEVAVHLDRPVQIKPHWINSRHESYWHWYMWSNVATRLAWKAADWRGLDAILKTARRAFQPAWAVELNASLAGPTARLAMARGDQRPYQHLQALLTQPDLDLRAGAAVYDDLLRHQAAIARETDQPEASLLWAAAVAHYTWRRRPGWAAYMAQRPPAVIDWASIPATLAAPLVPYGYRPPEPRSAKTLHQQALRQS